MGPIPLDIQETRMANRKARHRQVQDGNDGNVLFSTNNLPSSLPLSLPIISLHYTDSHRYEYLYAGTRSRWAEQFVGN